MKHSHLFCAAPERIGLRASESLPLETGELRVAVRVSGISPGTESRCFAGNQAGAPQEGFIPGYQCAGQVVESRSSRYGEGDLIFSNGTGRSTCPRMWGAHTSEAIVHESRAFRLPAHAPMTTVALAKLAAIARHGIRMLDLKPTERVAVVGLGPVGFFSAAILHMQGYHPVGFDVSGTRCKLFQALGGQAVKVDPATPLADQVAHAAHPDVIVDATGVPALLQQLLQAGPDLPWGETLHPGLRLVVQGSYPAEVRFDYDTAFTREVTLLFPRDNTPNDLRDVLGWMCDGRLRLPERAVELVQPDDAQAVYTHLRDDRVLSKVFSWRDASTV